jgi:adenylate kinase
MESGKLVSDDIIRKVLEKKLAGPDCVRGFIADGFPRNLAQALKLQPIRRVDHAIHLFVDTQTTIERLTSRINCPKCGEVYGPGKPPKRDGVCDKCNAKLIKRQDDAALEAVVQRLELYWTEMLPILEYYRYAGVLTTINGVQSIDAIAAQIAKAVNA